jgi:type I restriction enzyme S subunit
MRANFKIPSGWSETTFGAIVTTVSVNDKKLPRGEYLESGLFPVVDQGQQFIGGYSNDETKVISEDLPVLVFGDHTRAFKYLDQPFVAGADGIKVLKPIGVDAKWLYQIAHALEFPDKGYARHYQHLKTAKIFVPPLPEQRRIVAEIEKQFSRLEEGVTALKRVQANLKRYRAAVLKAACEGRLVTTEAELALSRGQKSEVRGQKKFESGEQLLKRILEERRKNWNGRGKYKEPTVPDTTNLPQLPLCWTWLSVEAIGFVTKLAGFEYTKYVQYSEDGDLAVIKAENAGRNGFKRTEISRINSSTVAQLTRSQLKAGDLLMVFVGAGTGNVARVPDDQPYFLGPNIAMIRVEPHFVSEAYLEMFLRSPLGHSLTFGFIKAVAQPSLSMGTIRMIPVALPPLAEQKRIVEEVERRLSVVEELESLVTANLQRATRLRQSILQKAFEGELV